MNADKIEALKQQRASLAERLAIIEASPEADGEDVREIEGVIRSIDQAVAQSERASAPPARAPGERAPSAALEHVVVVGHIRKNDRTEVRVSVDGWKGRRTIDIRMHYIPPGQTEMVPTRKGVTLDASRIDELIEALKLARQHLPQKQGA